MQWRQTKLEFSAVGIEPKTLQELQAWYEQAAYELDEPWEKLILAPKTV